MKNNEECIKEKPEREYAVRREREYDYRAVGVVGSASFCVVLPKSYAIDLGIAKGDFVRVHQEQNKIVIEKA